MNIQPVFEAVQRAIQDFKSKFPELINLANIDELEKQAIEAIKAYEIKLTLIDKNTLEAELQGHRKTALSIFDRGFHYPDDGYKADNICFGLIEMGWIEAFLRQMNNRQEEAETLEPQPQKIEALMSKFRLRESILSKADFIRIINALYEMKAFEKVNSNGEAPNKKDAMIAFGNIVGLDLSNYSNSLSNALDNSEEINYKIFEVMKEKSKAFWNETLQKRKNKYQ